MPSYRSRMSAPHKDVLHLTILLEDRVEPGMYQKIALRELAGIDFRPERGEPPIYEVCFEFLKPASPQNGGPGHGKSERLARVTIRRPLERNLPELFAHGGPGSGVETTLY